jgi:hypothetical protein
VTICRADLWSTPSCVSPAYSCAVAGDGPWHRDDKPFASSEPGDYEQEQ